MDLKKIEFHSHMALGDTLALTCAIRDLKESYPDKYAIRVKTNCSHIWDYNPYLSDFDKPSITVELGPRRFIQGSQTRQLHYCNAFRESIEENLNIPIRQGPIKPDLHLSKEEKASRIIDGKYWIIVPGGKSDFSTKHWPAEYWQMVISAFPDITFVQVGERTVRKDMVITSPFLKGDNLIDFVGKTEHPETGLRDLFRLFYHSEGSLGLVSMQMHLAAAFDKACVVVAGAREPASFEAYNHHRYLHYQGSLRCKNDCENCKQYSVDAKKKKFCGEVAMFEDFWKDRKLCPTYDPIDTSKLYLKACWKSGIDACTNPVEYKGTIYPKCQLMISPEDVIKAIDSYYDGGALQPSKEKARVNAEYLSVCSTEQKAEKISVPTNKKIFKMVCNAHAYIGGEKSVTWIMKAMEKKGYHVQLVPTKHVCDTFRKNMGENTQITNNLTDRCDIIMIYSNDMSYDFNKDHYKIMEKVQADKKILMLNYKMGAAGKEPWTKTWDLYGFLCTQMEQDFLKLVPGVNTFVLPPAVDIEPYLADNISYNKTLNLVRHSSQGDKKYPENFNDVVSRIRDIYPSAKMSFMPYPSFLNGQSNVYRFAFDEIPVIDFLKMGSCYWYMLPENYSDQGPRTIVEAMAIGLPCIADNRWGAKDRITEETGWLCDDQEDYYDVIKTLDHKILSLKGQAAKARARDCFNPNRWIEEITA